MGLLGGSKSSSSTSVEETNITTADNRVTEADKAIVGGNISVSNKGYGDISVQSTDYGALDAASEISDRAFEFAGLAGDRLTEGIEASLSTAGEAVTKAANIASEATRDESARTQQFLILGGIFVAVTIAYFQFKGRK